MARLLFAGAGALIGAYTPIGVGWGWAIGSMIGGALFPEQLPDVVQQGPRLNDLSVQSSAYGIAIPWVRGTMRLAGNIIWSEPLTEVVTTTTQEQGGKGGPSQTVTTTTYQYFATFAIAFCEGEMAGVRRLWFNGEMIFDQGVSANSGDHTIGMAEWSGKFRVYNGSESQIVDSAIEDYEGVGLSSAYRGTAYIVFEGIDVTQHRTIPIIEAEIVKDGSIGQSIQYFDGMESIATTYANNAAVYVNDTNEVWVVDSGYGTIAPPVPDRIAIYNLSTAAWSYVSLPTAFPFASVDDARHIVIEPRLGTVYVGGDDGGGNYNTLVFSIGARTFIDDFYSNISPATNVAELVAIDASRMRALVFHGIFQYGIYTITSTGTLGAELARITIDVSGGFFPPGSVGADGSFFFRNINGWRRIYLAAGVWTYEAIATSADGISMGKDRECYDASRDCIYFWSSTGGTSEYLLKLDCATRTISRVSASPIDTTVARNPWSQPILYAEDRDTIVAVKGDGTANFGVFELTPTTGAVTTYIIPDDGGTHFGGLPAYAPGMLWSFSAEFNSDPATSGIGEFRFSGITSSPPTLAQVHTDICAEVGLTAGQLDVTALTGTTVRGYAVARLGTARAAIEPLMHRYAYDCVESGGKIKAVLRGGATAYAFAHDELVIDAAGGRNPTLKAIRKDELSLPREVRAQYPDVNARYAIGEQYERFLGGSYVDVQQLNSTIVMSADEARQFCARSLYAQHAGRWQMQWATSHEFVWLEPTDIVTLTRGSVTYTGRLVDKRYAKNRVEWSAETDDINVYTQAVTGGTVAASIATIARTVSTQFALLDIPLLRDQDDSVGIYAAASGYSSTWRGADLWRSSDGGSTYTRTSASFLTAAPIGAALTVLGNFTGGNTIDEANSVDVYVSDATLSSTTNLLMLAGTNAAYLGGEIIGYRDAALIAANTYRLTGLLRGLRGTEQYMTTHAVGDRFVGLSSGSLRRIALATAEIGASLLYRAASFGQATADASVQALTFASVSQECLSPVQLAAGRTADANWDITIKWARRGRVSAEWRDYVDVPLGETSESYEVDIFTSGWVFKRTLTSATQSVTYLNADQVTDFGTSQTTVYVKIYQLSAAVGRGFAATGTLTV